MRTWKDAQSEVLARLGEARRAIDAHDEGEALAIVNQQDAFCDAAGQRRDADHDAGSDAACHYCQGYQAGGCMGRLDAIDRAVLHGQWDEARRLVDEYTAWVKSLDVGA